MFSERGECTFGGGAGLQTSDWLLLDQSPGPLPLYTCSGHMARDTINNFTPSLNMIDSHFPSVSIPVTLICSERFMICFSVQGRISGGKYLDPKETKAWKRLHNNLHLCFCPIYCFQHHSINGIKWEVHVAYNRQLRITSKIVNRKPEGKRLFRRIRRDIVNVSTSGWY